VQTDEESFKRAETFCFLEIREAISYYKHQRKESRDDLFGNKEFMTINGKLKHKK